MRSILLFAVVITAGCVTTSEIVPAGKDSYMVAGTGVGGLGQGKDGIAALKAANSYCAKMGKFMQILRKDGESNFNATSTNLIFSCLNENDPEYQRPDLHRDPNTVIEDARHH